MTTGRPAKRARKKERRDARRVEYARYYQRRRRRRRSILGGITLIVVLVAALFAILTVFKPASHKSPSGSPAASASGTVVTPVKQPVACGAKLPATAGSKKHEYGAPADQHLAPAKTYLLRLQTSCGTIDISLDVKNSPKTSNSVAFLASRHFYDGTYFHRILQNFSGSGLNMAQGGDAKGDGTGGPGYSVDEPPPQSTKYTGDIVAMAKSGSEPAGTSGSQFFIMSAGSGDAGLPADYAVLGKVVAGDDVIAKIAANGHLADGPPPNAYVYIEHATIVAQ